MSQILSKRFLGILIIIFLFIGFSSCMSGGIPVWFPTSEGGGTSGPDTSTQGSSSTAGNPSIDGEETAFIPLPSNFLVTSNGVAESESGMDSAMIVIGTNTTKVAEARVKEQNSLLARVEKNYIHPVTKTLKHLINKVVPAAFAEYSNTDCPADTDNYEFCLYPSSDGSLTAIKIENFTYGDTLSFRYYDPATGEYSDAENETAVAIAVYTSQDLDSASLITSDGSAIYQVSGDGSVIKLGFAGGRVYTSSGSFDDHFSYAEYGDTVNGFHYDSNKSAFVINQGSKATAKTISSTGDIEDLTDGGESCFGSGTECYKEPDTGCEYNALKIRGAKAFMSETCDEGKKKGYIYELYENATNVINFFDNETMIDYYSSFFLSTKAFDVYVNESDKKREHLVVFEDTDGDVYLFGRYNKNDSSDVTTELDSVDGIKDLIIITPQSEDGTTAGTAVLLHSAGATFISYNLVECDTEEIDCSNAPDVGITLGSTISISSPVAITTNSTDPSSMTHAFVMSSDGTASTAGDKITVIDLASETLDTTTYADLYQEGSEGEISLSNLFADHTFTDFDPAGIYFTSLEGDDALYIPSNTMKLGILVDL